MNDPHDAFDWSALGDEPLPGEMDDDALLREVLAQTEAAPEPEQLRARPARWVRPAVAAVVLLAAAIVFFVYAPAWTDVSMGADDDGSLAPDVEAEDDGDTARMHAKAEAEPEPAPKKRLAPFPEAPPPAPPEAAADAEPQDDPDEETTRPKPQPRDPAPTADALLREAQDAMAAKDSAGAIRKYDVLLRKHPRSAEARAARITLGRLELNAGDARRALAHYDAYLEGSGGAMRREAELGRIDALRELGRTEAERAAIEDFLDDYPSTVHATRLRSRLDALR